MKPILFNTEMVRAILDGRKTVTRRVVNPQPPNAHMVLDYDEDDNSFDFVCGETSDGLCIDFAYTVKAPYRPGDILYVRETWAAWSRTLGIPPTLYYKADEDAPDGIKWRPSIHMPSEAARIFLRVTDVRVERLQDITEEQARAEGAEPFMMTADVDKPDDEKRWQEMLPALSMFPALWDSAIKPADHALYGWYANPWVWVIEFKRCEKSKGD